MARKKLRRIGIVNLYTLRAHGDHMRSGTHIYRREECITTLVILLDCFKISISPELFPTLQV